MDGYAVDKVKCEVYKVVTYKSLAGTDPKHQVVSPDLEEETKVEGVAVYVTTGAPVPDGFISVVPIENAEKLDN